MSSDWCYDFQTQIPISMEVSTEEHTSMQNPHWCDGNNHETKHVHNTTRGHHQVSVQSTSLLSEHDRQRTYNVIQSHRKRMPGL
jgi:hypothetical protein